MYNEKIQLHLYEFSNNAFKQIAIIDDYEEISFNDSYFEAGDFTVTINFNIPNAVKFKRGLFIQFGDDPYRFGEILSINSSIDEGGKGSQYKTITGKDSRFIFKKRIIKNLNNEVNWSMTAKGELCIRNLINDQCGSNAEIKRRLPVENHIPESENALGKEYSVNESYTNLYDALVAIATQSEIGWRNKFQNNILTLEIYEGTDKSQSVQFSVNFDSLRNGNISDSSESFANVIYVGGKGNGLDRDIYEGESAINNESPAGLERFEAWDSQNNMTNEDEYESEARSMLNQYGQTMTADGQGLAKSPYVYKKEYNVGDFILISFNNEKAKVQILSVSEVWSGRGNYDIAFTFGKPKNDLSKQLQLILKQIQKATNSMESNTVNSVKWYEIPDFDEQEKKDIIYNTLGFTGNCGANGHTFTLYWDDEKTGSKSYNIYFKNLVGGNITFTTGVADTSSVVMKSGTYTACIYVDEEGNVKLNSQSVSVNPSGQATATAETIEVGGTVYNLSGSGGSGIPLGTILPYRGSTLPSDEWLWCDGSTFDAEEYPALYMFLNSNTLPDLRNKAIMGANPDVEGKADGNTSNLGDVQLAQLPNIKGLGNAQGPRNNDIPATGAIKSKYVSAYGWSSGGSNNRVELQFDASLNDSANNQVGSKDHLGNNVYFGDFDNSTEANRTYGETRPANIRLNFIIKATQSSNDSDYASTLEAIREYVDERANKGMPLGTCIGVENDVAPNDGWLKCDGSTFDADTYPALAMMLGGNTLPVRFDKTRPSEYESFTINNTNTLVPYDGIINIQGALSWSQIYVNDVLIGLTTDTSQKASDCTIYVKKGDYVRWGNAVVQNAYARWFKHPLFIKATPSSNDTDYQGILATFQNFILNQNKLSDYEAITLSTTNLQVEYDGLITVNMYSISGVYVNDIQVASIRDVSGTPNSVTIPVNKGDNVKISGTFRFAYARWYKNRYYEN